MTAIKHALQRDLFTPNDERLLGVVHVAKTGKKKKSSFLCASVTTEHPVEVYITKIKKQDKGDLYKRQKKWHLRELKMVDGKDSKKDSTDFDLLFDKNFKWFASSVSEKHTFLSCLWKLCRRYLPRLNKPTFKNVPESLMEVSVSGSESQRTSGSGPGTDGFPTEENYQVLTSKEETDLERMLSECENAISDAEAFASNMSKDLSVLDGENISSIMGSEAQVNQLMSLLDNALDEVTAVETRLDGYNDMVQSISGQMGQMKNQESFIQITNKNHTMLLQELDKLVLQLDLSKGHIKALNEGDLRVDSGIEACSSAAEALQHAMQVELHPGVYQLVAVREQQKMFEDLRQKFAKRLYHFLYDVFMKQGNEQAAGGLARQANNLKLPKHFPYHRDLLPYKQLVLWLKVADKTKYQQLCGIYTQSLCKLYSREITEFMTNAKQRFIEKATISPQMGAAAFKAASSSTMSLNTQASKERKGSKAFGGLSKKLSSSIKNLSGSSQSLSKQHKKLLGGSTQSLNVKSMGKKLKKLGSSKKHGGLAVSRESLAASDFELSDREKFSSTFREVLNELEPTCQDEEDFLTRFFHLNIETADTLMPGGSDDEEDDTEQGAARRKQYQETSLMVQVVKDIRRMMTEIFTVVEPQLLGLVAFGEKLDPLNSLNMLVVIGDRVAKARQDNDGSFLAKMLGNSLIEVKRNFDNFMNHKITVVQEAHLSKNKKCGILPFVTDFEDFAELAESIFKDSHRRNDLDKAYKGLIKAVFDAIERLAMESYKTPREVVLFENYHNLHDFLARLKIVGLEQERKEAKTKYNDNLQNYVSSLMGRPLEKLSNFFEGVEQVMEGGVRAEEVSFQLKFSKQELRKCIKEYTGKDVKKGLEALYHKITKHTSDNENRLQRVVWQYMQDEFLRQYKHFEDLINKCYPGSGMKLEFTIQDVLQYFTDIALSQEK
uniref:exocyst complex component 1-like isoform X3 n=1 Tax=Styela clava TaxID=7725 RepID=UPI00193A4D82|nr:exocyst complex component 1-like isoform X3 [Styela clava]